MPVAPCCLMLSVNRFEAKYTMRHNTTLNTYDPFVTISKGYVHNFLGIKSEINNLPMAGIPTK